MKPARTYICHALALSVGVFITVFLFQLFDRNPVVVLDTSHSYVMPDPAVPGQAVTIIWSAVEKRNCDGIVLPRIIDSAGTVFQYADKPTSYHDLLVAGARTFSKPMTLPAGIAPGRARYEPVIRRWCNWAQRYVWPMVDEPFPIWFDVAPAQKTS